MREALLELAPMGASLRSPISRMKERQEQAFFRAKEWILRNGV